MKKELARLLLAQHQREQKAGSQADAKCSAAVEETQLKRRGRIESLDRQLQQLDGQLESTEKEVSRLEVLIQEKKVRLDTGNKALMDSLKIIARNAFYRALAPFKRAYDNYRDDHDYFRNLTQAHGILVNRGKHLEVHLMTPVNYPPKIRGIVQGLLLEINASALSMPDGSRRTLRFLLGEKQGIKLAPSSS